MLKEKTLQEKIEYLESLEEEIELEIDPTDFDCYSICGTMTFGLYDFVESVDGYIYEEAGLDKYDNNPEMRLKVLEYTDENFYEIFRKMFPSDMDYFEKYDGLYEFIEANGEKKY